MTQPKLFYVYSEHAKDAEMECRDMPVVAEDVPVKVTGVQVEADV